MQTKYLIVLAIGLAAFAAAASAQSFPAGPLFRAGPISRRAEWTTVTTVPAAADPTYEVQPLPPPGVAAEPTVPAPPRDFLSEPPAYPADRPGPAPRRDYVTGASGWEPIRPPGDISAPRANGPYAAPAAPTSPPADAPTGAIGVPKTSPASNAYAAFPPDYRPEEGKPKHLSPHLQRQVVTYPTPEPAGTIIVDTPNTFLYLVLGDGKAMRYGIGVGRDGFTWSGVESVSNMAEWPDWHPPPEMIERQPYLPRFMAGGESNPLGARALYLGKSIYRIHGTNQPSTIGTFVSSGCIRLTNADVEDLYRRVNVGTRVVVLAGKPNHGQKPGPGSAAELPSSSQVIR